MMINVSFAELFMPASTTASEPLAKQDVIDQSEQDFAAFLATSFTAVSTPVTPEPLPINITETPVSRVEATPVATKSVNPNELLTPIAPPSAFDLCNSTETLDSSSAFSAFPALPDATELGAETVKQAASIVKTIAAEQEAVAEKNALDNAKMIFLPDAPEQAASSSRPLLMRQVQATESATAKYEDAASKDTNWRNETAIKDTNLPNGLIIKDSYWRNEAAIKDTNLPNEPASKEANWRNEAVVAFDSTNLPNKVAPTRRGAVSTGLQDFSLEKPTMVLLRQAEEVHNNIFSVEWPATILVRNAEEAHNDAGFEVVDKLHRLSGAVRAMNSQDLETVGDLLIKPVSEAKLPTEPNHQPPAAPPFSTPELRRELSSLEPSNFAALEIQPEPAFSEPPENTILITKNSGLTISPLPFQGTVSSPPPVHSAVPQSGSTPPLLSQTIQPLIELARNTPPRETRTLHLSLHPEALGRIEVEITRDAVGQVSASLTAEHIEAANTLTHGISHLRESLEQAGLTIERLEVMATPQFQNSAQGQAGNQQQARPQPSAEADYLPLNQPNTDGTVADEEEKLLSLRA